MQLRKLVLACGFASFALSNYASALGLGEVKLNSKLNQPLSAEIKLLDTRDLSAEQILIALASPADFERNGVERLYFYTEFQFEVVLDKSGGPVVKVTTRNPVREPYLNFLVEARWTAGRLLREYTLLMDLPTFDDAAPQAVQAASSPKVQAPKPAPAEAAVKPKPAPVEAPAAPAASPASAAAEEKPAIIAEQDQATKKPKPASGTYGPIGSNDTLWDIARSVRPDSSVSIHQTMMALKRLNPDAFINGNINLLKKGQVLRVPDTSEAASVSKTEALTQFTAQVNDSSGTSTSTTALGAQLDATHRATETRHQAETVSGRVKLEAPSTQSKGTSGQGSGSNKGTGKALETELASTLEELDKAKSEKTELSSRVHDLEDQVKTMQRLVDVSNEKLRAMQLAAVKQTEKPAEKPVEKAIEKPAEKPAAKVEPVAAQVSSAAEKTQVASSVEQSSVASVEKSSAPEVKPAPKKPAVVPPPPPEKSAVDLLTDSTTWIVLGILGLLGGGLIYVARRRAAAELEEQEAEAVADDIYENEPDFSAFSEDRVEPSFEEVISQPHDDEFAELQPASESIEAETGDVVGEADIYIAYGKYDQAEDMLLNALAKDPQSTDIRSKLLEVYSHTGDLANFDKHFGAIKAGLTSLAVSRVLELRSNIPGAGDVPESFIAATDDALPEEDASSLNNADFGVKTESLDDEFNFDLALDDDNTLTSEEDLQLSTSSYSLEPEAPKSQGYIDDLDDDFALDFDLATPSNSIDEAEDLSEISSAIDNLRDNSTLVDDSELKAATEATEDEFAFDFDDMEVEEGQLAKEVEAIKYPELSIADDLSEDEFNLDMDVANVDLAALDQEMEGLDAELAALDNEALTISEDEFTAGDDLASLDASAYVNDELSLDTDEDLHFEVEDDADLDTLSFDEPNLLAEDDDLEELDVDLSEEDLALFNEDTELEEIPETSSFTEIASEDADGENSADDFDVSLEDELPVEFELPLEPDVSEPSSNLANVEESEDFNLADVEDLEGADFASLEEPEGVDFAPVGKPEDVNFANVGEPEDVNFANVEESEGVNFANVDEPENLNLADMEELEDISLVDVADDLAHETSALELDSSQVDESALDVIADDDLFEQALSDFNADELVMDENSDFSDDDMDAELDFMADADESATKLDLARAYIDMGDAEGARDILVEVAHEGNDQQRQEAVDLMSRIDV